MNAVLADPGASEREFARLLAEEIVTFEPEDLSDESLALIFVVSAYLRCCHVDLAEAEAALACLRRALVNAAGLSLSEEPLPLPVADRKQRVLNLCHYTYSLIGRASSHMRESKLDVVRAAMTLYGQVAPARTS